MSVVVMLKCEHSSYITFDLANFVGKRILLFEICSSMAPEFDDPRMTVIPIDVYPEEEGYKNFDVEGFLKAFLRYGEYILKPRINEPKFEALRCPICGYPMPVLKEKWFCPDCEVVLFFSYYITSSSQMDMGSVYYEIEKLKKSGVEPGNEYFYFEGYGWYRNVDGIDKNFIAEAKEFISKLRKMYYPIDELKRKGISKNKVRLL